MSKYVGNFISDDVDYFLNRIIATGIRNGTSDIHFESTENAVIRILDKRSGTISVVPYEQIEAGREKTSKIFARYQTDDFVCEEISGVHEPRVGVPNSEMTYGALF